MEHKKKVSGTAATRRWKQTFSVGYIQQAFTRACVREALRHGEENAPFLQRIDALRANTYLAGAHKKFQRLAGGADALNLRPGEGEGGAGGVPSAP